MRMLIKCVTEKNFKCFFLFQGEFRINLAGTGLAITTSTQWSSYGRSAVQQIDRTNVSIFHVFMSCQTKNYSIMTQWFLQNGVIVTGKCGGYCGQCRPDPLAGMILTHIPTR